MAQNLARCVAITDLFGGADVDPQPVTEHNDHGHGPVYALTVLGDNSITQVWCTGEVVTYDRIGDVDETHDGCPHVC